MRTFLLIFLASWLGGIVAGINGAWWGIVVLSAGLLGVLGRFGWDSSAFKVAAVCLGLLGFVWGSVFAVQPAGCVPGQTSSGVIVSAVDVLESSLRFVFEDDTGCHVLVTADRWERLFEGDLITLSGGEVQDLVAARDYSAGYADYLERRGISGTWVWPDITVVRDHSPPLFTKLRHTMRDRVIQVFTEPDASVVLALLFADRGTLSDVLEQQFRASGVSHIIAISGLHISLLVGLLLGLFLLLPLSSRVRTFGIMLLLWLYVVFIGLPASALRAALFWTVALVALRWHRLVSLPAIIALSASVMITIRPLFVFDVGWQLSMSAVAGIFGSLFLTRGWYEEGHWRWLLTAILVSVGATLATWPLVLWHFGTVSLLGVLVNLVVVPLVPLLLLAAIGSLVVSFIWLPAALGLSFLFHLLLLWLQAVTGLVAGLPGAYFEDVSISGWVVLVYYLGLVVGAMLVVRHQGRSWREVWG